MTSWLKFLRVMALSVAAATLPAAAVRAAAGMCPSSDIIGAGMLSNVCWNCIFPVRVAGFTMFGSPISAGGTDANGFALSSRPSVPAEATKKAVCLCDTDALPTVGIPTGMWLPSTLYETTLTPGCSSTLGGIEIGIADPLYRGTSGNPSGTLTQQSFNHIHTYSYPIVMLMELFSRCHRGYTDIDILYLSEIDPMWNDPIIAMYGNPISVFGASLTAVAACSADAVSASLGKPLDDLFWCGGGWSTTMTPYTGYQHAQGPVQYSSASSQRLMAMNHARGVDRRMVGTDALCRPQFQPMVKRSHYRWQTAWPRAEGRRNHASGESLLRWGASRSIPGVAEQPIYLRWDWVDCCSPIIGR